LDSGCIAFLKAIFSAVADRAAKSIDGAFIVLAASIDGFCCDGRLQGKSGSSRPTAKVTRLTLSRPHTR
jgi:hypothetical protein